MRRQARSEPPLPHDVLTLAAATWLACGVVLFGLTPLPWRDATLGWSPAFWLVVAPFLLLVAKRVSRPQRPPMPARRKARSSQQAGAPAIRRRNAVANPGHRKRPMRRTAA